MSRRSGTLQLTTASDTGEIVFYRGLVVASSRAGNSTTIGEGLMGSGALEPMKYQEMLAAQSQGARGPDLLAEYGLDQEDAKEAIADLLKADIYEMLTWDEGGFSFVLEASPDPWRGFAIDATRTVVIDGLNPQYLAMEGARLKDEDGKPDALDEFLAQRGGEKPHHGPAGPSQNARQFAEELAQQEPGATPNHAGELGQQEPPATVELGPGTSDAGPDEVGPPIAPAPNEPPAGEPIGEPPPSAPPFADEQDTPGEPPEEAQNTPTHPAHPAAVPSPVEGSEIDRPEGLIPPPASVAQYAPPKVDTAAEMESADAAGLAAAEATPPNPESVPSGIVPPPSTVADYRGGVVPAAEGTKDESFAPAPETTADFPPEVPQSPVTEEAGEGRDRAPKTGATFASPVDEDRDREDPAARVGEASSEPLAAAGSTPSHAPRPTRHLVVVDDDRQILELINGVVGGFFDSVQIATSVEQALGYFAEPRADLVAALDLIIPRSDGAGILGGLQILERARELNVELPVVLFSDYQNREAEQQAKILGVEQVLIKPRKNRLFHEGSKTLTDEARTFLDSLGNALAPHFAPSAPEGAQQPEANADETPEPVMGHGEEPPPAPGPETTVQAAPVSPAGAEPTAPGPQTEPFVPSSEEGLSAARTPESSEATLEGPEIATPSAEVENPQKAPAPASAPAGNAGAPAPSPAQTPPSGIPALPMPSAAAQEMDLSGNTFDLGRELATEMAGESDLVDDLPPAHKMDGPMGELRSMLSELADPANRETVTLLVLRFAADVVDRAALFLATRTAYVGLGGFSLGEGSEEFVKRVRRIKIPVNTDSIFARVSRFRSLIRAPLKESPGNRRLLAGLGTPDATLHPDQNADTIAVPLISGGRVAVILYGDNPSGGEIGPTHALEIFMQQAGVTMERTLLERRLEEMKRTSDS